MTAAKIAFCSKIGYTLGLHRTFLNLAKEKIKVKDQKNKRFMAWLRPSLVVVGILSFFYAGYALAADGGQSLGTIAGTITGSFKNLAMMISAASYVAGVGFALSAILKFKQHKDNPTQIPIGTPIALLFIAAGLIFLPTIFGVANQTIFGGSGTAGGVSGSLS